MDSIMEIAQRHNLIVIEDNAYGLFGTCNGRKLGTIGHMATQSCHETKNITYGEGGALVINDSRFSERAEILHEKGTNRANFFRGEVDKYTWVDKGSGYLMSDILAACLYAQLSKSSEIQEKRKIIWSAYFCGPKGWAVTKGVQLPYVPEDCEQAFHMFYLILPSTQARINFIDHMNSEGVSTVFHYLPLHESPMGKRYNTNNNKCPVTCEVSGRLVRLPFFNDLTHDQLNFVISVVTRLHYEMHETFALFTLGKKVWLFAEITRGADAGATCYSLKEIKKVSSLAAVLTCRIFLTILWRRIG